MIKVVLINLIVMFLWYIRKFMKVEEYINGGYSNIYEPYRATALRPNYEFRINNSYYHINSLGFRSKELIEPKAPEVFRVFRVFSLIRSDMMRKYDATGSP